MTMVINTTPSSCGQSNGSISIEMTGGQFPYTYSVAGRVQSNPNFTGLRSGVYEVTVTDASGCRITDNARINDIDGPALVTEIMSASCGQSNGSIVLSATGGAPPYTYYLNEMESSTGEYGGLITGVYVAKVVDENGCEVIEENFYRD